MFSKAEAERLLEPWLGQRARPLGPAGAAAHRSQARERPGRRPEAPANPRLVEALPGVASLDDHALWLQRLSTAANAFVGIGIGLVVLVLIATGLAVTFATRGAMASNREVVEVLHFVGADDDYIARAFQRRFFGLGLRGGAIGAGLAISAFVHRRSAGPGRALGPAGQEVEALFGAFHVGCARLCQRHADRRDRVPRHRRRLAHHGAAVPGLRLPYRAPAWKSRPSRQRVYDRETLSRAVWKRPTALPPGRRNRRRSSGG